RPDSFSPQSVFFFQAEDGIRDFHVTGVQTCALPISAHRVLAIQLAQVDREYTVRRGDTLSLIATRHDVSLASLRQANGLRNDQRSEERRVGKERRSRWTA